MVHSTSDGGLPLPCSYRARYTVRVTVSLTLRRDVARGITLGAEAASINCLRSRIARSVPSIRVSLLSLHTLSRL